MVANVQGNYNFAENYGAQSDHPTEGITLSAFFCGTGETPNAGHQLIPKLFSAHPGDNCEDIESKGAPGKVAYTRKHTKDGRNQALIFNGVGAQDQKYAVPEGDTTFIDRVVTGYLGKEVAGAILGTGIDNNIALALKEIEKINRNEADANNRVSKLNIAGWSRGSYTGTQRLPRVIYEIQQGDVNTISQFFELSTESEDKRMKDITDIQAAFSNIEINLLAIDTVRGPTNHSDMLRDASERDGYLYPNVKNYMQLLALNENSVCFSGEVPQVKSSDSDMNQYIIPLPGTHSQLAGNAGARWSESIKGDSKDVVKLSEHLAVDYLMAMGTPINTTKAFHSSNPSEVLDLLLKIEDKLKLIESNSNYEHYLYFAYANRHIRYGDTFKTLEQIDPGILATAGSFSSEKSSKVSKSLRQWLISETEPHMKSQEGDMTQLLIRDLSAIIDDKLKDIGRDSFSYDALVEYIHGIDYDHREQAHAKLIKASKVLDACLMKQTLADEMEKLDSTLEACADPNARLVQSALKRGVDQTLMHIEDSMKNIDRCSADALVEKVIFMRRMMDDFVSPVLMVDALIKSSQSASSEERKEDFVWINDYMKVLTEFCQDFDIELISELLANLEPGDDLKYIDYVQGVLDKISVAKEDDPYGLVDKTLVEKIKIELTLLRKVREFNNEVRRGHFKSRGFQGGYKSEPGWLSKLVRVISERSTALTAEDGRSLDERNVESPVGAKMRNQVDSHKQNSNSDSLGGALDNARKPRF